MQEHRDAHNPHISQVVPKDNKSKVRYYDNKVVSHDGKRYAPFEAAACLFVAFVCQLIWLGFDSFVPACSSRLGT